MPNRSHQPIPRKQAHVTHVAPHPRAGGHQPLAQPSGWLLRLLGLLFITLVMTACAPAMVAPGTQSLAMGDPPTATPTHTDTTVATSAPSASPTHTATPTHTPTPTLTPTPTISPTPTITPTPTPTPGPTPDGQIRSARVPILMYHYISEPPPGSDAYRRKLSLDPEIFQQHLDYLQEQGYTTIRLADLISYLQRGFPELPPKPIVLTFDDGYKDNYLNAFPALRARGMIGTFFVITDFVDLAASDPNYARYATWDAWKEMAAAGMEIGSHSRNHPDLRGKDTDYLVWQALGSSQTIEANLGQKPRVLAYPSGSYDRSVIDIFHSAGFWGAVTTQPGVEQDNQHLFELKRLRISNQTGVAELAQLLRYWQEH